MSVLATLGEVAVAAGLLGGGWRTARRVVRIADAVQELSPNSGHSIKDTVGRIDGKVDVLTARFDDHLKSHERS